jgi:NAD dependent epimerase/dehydratase family enzyme
VINRPSLLPAPAFAVKLALGEFAEYALNGRRVVPAALEQADFEFRYSELADALSSLEQ